MNIAFGVFECVVACILLIAGSELARDREPGPAGLCFVFVGLFIWQAVWWFIQ